jgi:glycosyltransferase involved in cell wall biosynthesis
MKILYLTFYFEPDLCAGSFRNTTLVKEISRMVDSGDSIHVITTMPNRYKSFSEEALSYQIEGNIEINRIKLSGHKSGFFDQGLAYRAYFFNVLRLIKNRDYDLVFASSSRLLTATTGSMVSRIKRIPLYLDIRDIFVDTLQDVIKNRIVKSPLIFLLRRLENFTFSRAKHINLISGGFEDYFKKYTDTKYSFFPNGIDDEFLDAVVENTPINDPFIITYAGNIGEGQGLEKIIPQAAKILGPRYRFIVIGDGGRRKVFEETLDSQGITNVELRPPTNRSELIEYYNKSHFLFLHLNNYKAFEKVLPSKIFEYGALNKPIIAGVGGYAADFVKNNLSNYILFSPGNVNDMVTQLENYTYQSGVRTQFRTNFSRKAINLQMAKSILEYC